MSKAFAFKTLESYYHESSSGGAFTNIAESFFEKGEGYVYGAILDDDLTVKHDRVSSLGELGVFRKSKYVRSNVSCVFKRVVDDLNNDKRVLFSGTPCNIYSLFKYLEKNQVSTDKLFTIDFVCNGAPSPTVWKDYVNWIEAKVDKKLIYFGFREKGDDKNPYLTKAVFEGGYTIKDKPITACYNRLFLKKLIDPSGCFNCKFKREERVSDITIADFWGSEEILSRKELKKGTSLVLVNTTKGDSLFSLNSQANKNILIDSCKDRSYLKYQGNLRGISHKPAHYDEFWDEYKSKGFEYVANKYADACFPFSIKYSIRKLVRIIRYIK